MQNDTEHKGKSVPGTNRNTFDANHFNSLGGESKRLSNSNFRQNQSFSQCRRCRSDYMRFAEDGFCLDCQQKVEFIVREHSHILQERRV